MTARLKPARRSPPQAPTALFSCELSRAPDVRAARPAGPKPGPKWWQSILTRAVLAAGVVAVGYFGYRRFTAPKLTFEAAMQRLDRQIQVP